LIHNYYGPGHLAHRTTLDGSGELDAGKAFVMHPSELPSAECPICGGPAEEAEVAIDFWRGAIEPIAILGCKDVACKAYGPTGWADL
jgi:hypothetical protein